MTAIEVHERLEELVVHGAHSEGSTRDCPLFHIRQLTMKSRRRYLNSLSDDEKRKLLLAHVYCSEGLLGDQIEVN